MNARSKFYLRGLLGSLLLLPGALWAECALDPELTGAVSVYELSGQGNFNCTDLNMGPVAGVATNETIPGSDWPTNLNWWITDSGASVDAVVVEDSNGKRCVYNYGPGAIGGEGLKPPSKKPIADYDVCADDYNPPAPNTAPTVEISYIAEESTNPDGSIPGGTAITFTGLASDLEDPDLTGEQLQWSSSLDGVLDNEGSSVFTVSDLSAGFHTITAQVADSGGLIGSASVELTIAAVVVQQCETIDGGVLINGVAVMCPEETNPEDPQPRVVCSADLSNDADKFELGVAACCVCNAEVTECDPSLAEGDNPVNGLVACPDSTAAKGALQVPTGLMFNNDPYYCITVGGRRTCYRY